MPEMPEVEIIKRIIEPRIIEDCINGQEKLGLEPLDNALTAFYLQARARNISTSQTLEYMAERGRFAASVSGR